MEVTFIGANHEVTGSCTYMRLCGKHVLVDCGLEQGVDVYERQELPVEAAEIDYVLLTHAHIDHTGLLPLLRAKGFRGWVYATKPTVDLCNIMLRDSAHIQMFEAEWRNRKAKRAGLDGFVPLYDMEDAVEVLKQFVPCAYDEVVALCEGIEVRFVDVGHLLGSASIEVWAHGEKGSDDKKKIVFSGDVGNLDQPIVKDPTYIKEADYVVMESTYGDRTHGARPDYVEALASCLKETFKRGGNVVIPAFAVGRTQELLYFLRQIKEEGRVDGYENFTVYLDSPLAIEATNVFTENVAACFDEEAMKLVRRGVNPLRFDGLKLTVSSEESKGINFVKEPVVILSASGMCEAGRIRHHLKHNLWRPESTILFVGYQAVGTLGRMLMDGVKTVRLFGEPIEVKAEVRRLDGVSGHADKDGLIKWVTQFEPQPQRVFIVHGEDSVCNAFRDELSERYGLKAEAPYSGSVFDLEADAWKLETVPVPVTPKKERAAKRARAVFERLRAAGERLNAIIRKSEGLNNKDVSRFADQIESLCDKWE